VNPPHDHGAFNAPGTVSARRSYDVARLIALIVGQSGDRRQNPSLHWSPLRTLAPALVFGAVVAVTTRPTR
jgi:hypothetical protein